MTKPVFTGADRPIEPCECGHRVHQHFKYAQCQNCECEDFKEVPPVTPLCERCGHNRWYHAHRSAGRCEGPYCTCQEFVEPEPELIKPNVDQLFLDTAKIAKKYYNCVNCGHLEDEHGQSYDDYAMYTGAGKVHCVKLHRGGVCACGGFQKPDPNDEKNQHPHLFVVDRAEEPPE